jgi:hypothetical protein
VKGGEGVGYGYPPNENKKNEMKDPQESIQDFQPLTWIISGALPNLKLVLLKTLCPHYADPRTQPTPAYFHRRRSTLTRGLAPVAHVVRTGAMTSMRELAY